MAASGVASGARGVVFGRNVFESGHPQNFLNALGEVVRDGVDPADRRRPPRLVQNQGDFTAEIAEDAE